jgi:hypothetical protein
MSEEAREPWKDDISVVYRGLIPRKYTSGKYTNVINNTD